MQVPKKLDITAATERAREGDLGSVEPVQNLPLPARMTRKVFLSDDLRACHHTAIVWVEVDV